LHYAVDAGHLEIVDLLLRAGANVNAYASYCTSLAA
jgi:ankyrin repeat protein